jgi:peptidoglycan/LPS O-acetylase OafA/YrhL
MLQEREQSSGTLDARRLPGLDRLRALAIVAVVLFHMPAPSIPDYLQPVHRFGWMGVDLFFVLSGYLIGTQLFKQCREGSRPALSRFYIRRALRVLPAFLEQIAIGWNHLIA